jgi:soluble lytic murein transglycosylase-like protein
MRNLRGTYVHRGDAARRRRRIQRLFLASAIVVLAAFVVENRRTPAANAAPARPAVFFSIGSQSRKLWQDLETTRGELTLLKAQYDRADQIIAFSTRYSVPAGLASSIFDASVRQGIDPELAFRLVNLESDFNDHAVSKTGALGLMQVMPSTGRLFEKSLTNEGLFNRETNLRIGFAYLRSLVNQYGGNVRLALLAYNRGEDAVWRDLRAGINPGNGYDKSVLKGYTGKGTLQEQ